MTPAPPRRVLRTLAPVVIGPALLAGLAIPPAAASRSTTSTPTCREWQTVTHVPVPGAPASKTGSASSTATPRTTPVCRNAPPKPFPQPVWAAESVVGGPRLAADGLVVDLPSGTPAPPRVPDVSYVLADLGTGEVLAAKAPHAWLRPASTLKTLTALTLIPRLDPRRVVVAKPEHEAANGTRVGVLAGNRYPVARLFDALLMSSANDAAYLLAEAAGGFEQTAALMNETARHLGAHDTVAIDPSGLDEEGQRSSAYDLALIGRAAMQLPEFRAYVTRRTAVFPGGKVASTGKVYDPFQIQNINDLLPNYPGAIGVKPGRTNRAQHTFIGAATRDDRTLIVTQMGSTTGDWRDTAALLDWGFAHADSLVPVGRLVEPGEAAEPSPAPTTSRTATPAASAGSAAAVDPTRTARPADRTAGIAADGPVGEGTATTVATGGIAILVLGLGAVSATFLARRRRHRPAGTDSPQ